jgi:hypothetical protein
MSRRTVVNALLLVAGAALFVWQVRSAGGPKAIAQSLAGVGIGILPILAISFARFVLRSYAWLALLDARVPLASAVAATISGDALGNLTPLSLAASEPAKAVYLRGRLDTTHALAALTAENFFYTISIALYIALGALAMLLALDVPAWARQGGIAVLAGVGILLLLAGWIAWRRPAALSAIVARLPFPAVARWVDHVREFETRTYGSTRPGAAPLARLAAAELAFHVLSFAELWLTLKLLTGESHPLQALLFDSLSRAINVVFKPVPMRLGVDEASATGFAAVIGIRPEIGLLTALVRRVRMLIWGAVGLGIWAQRHRQRRSEI